MKGAAAAAAATEATTTPAELKPQHAPQAAVEDANASARSVLTPPTSVAASSSSSASATAAAASRSSNASVTRWNQAISAAAKDGRRGEAERLLRQLESQ